MDSLFGDASRRFDARSHVASCRPTVAVHSRRSGVDARPRTCRTRFNAVADCIPPRVGRSVAERVKPRCFRARQGSVENHRVRSVPPPDRTVRAERAISQELRARGE